MILDNDKRIDEKIKGAMQPENAEKILIVDDEKDIRKLVGIYLKRQGYQILEAENGKQAIDLVRENSDIDLIIMDIMMPEKNGYQVLKEMREKGNRSPVLFLTARDALEDRVKGLDLGADDYLVKPFHFEELMARIRVMLRRNHGSVSNRLALADLTLDCDTHEVRRGEKRNELYAKELSIWEYMLRSTGIVFS